MWENLGRDVFSLLEPMLDGRELARCAATCKAWHRLVTLNPNSRGKRNIHYIYVKKEKYLMNAISKYKMADTTRKNVNTTVENILWFHHGLNPYFLIVNDSYETLPESICKSMGFTISLVRLKHQLNTNDIIILNEISDDFLNDLKSMRLFANLKHFETKLTNSFTWKCLHYPSSNQNYTTPLLVGQDRFYSGCTIALIFKTNGIDVPVSIRNELKQFCLTPDAEKTTKEVLLPLYPTLESFIEAQKSEAC